MGVEGGSSGGGSGGLGGAAAGVGATGGSIGGGIGASLGGIGRGLGEGSIGMGSAISAGPASISGFVSEGPGQGFGSLASFGPELKAPSLPFVNEGLAKGGLENTMSLYTLSNISPNKGIIEPTYQAAPTDPLAEIAEAASQPSSLISVVESFLSEARLSSVGEPKPVLIEEDAIAEAEHILGLDKPKVSAELQSGVIVDPDLPKLEAVRKRISLLGANQNTAATESEHWLGLPASNVRERNSIGAQSLLMLVASRVFSPIPLEIAAAVTPTPDVNQTIIAKAEPESGIQASTYIRSQTYPATAEISQYEEEEIEQEKEVEEVIEESVDNLEEEDVKKLKLKRVVDDRALSQIIVEIKQGIKKAKEITKILGTKITGSLLAKFLPGQHPGNESEDVKGKGLDGSIPERKEAIEAQGEFASEVEAEERSVRVAYEKPPIKVREHGKPVSDEDVYRVHKNRVKPRSTEVVLEIIKSRQLKKGTSKIIPMVKTEVEVVERRIEDAPELAEVFQKAA